MRCVFWLMLCCAAAIATTGADEVSVRVAMVTGVEQPSACMPEGPVEPARLALDFENPASRAAFAAVFGGHDVRILADWVAGPSPEALHHGLNIDGRPLYVALGARPAETSGGAREYALVAQFFGSHDRVLDDARIVPAGAAYVYAHRVPGIDNACLVFTSSIDAPGSRRWRDVVMDAAMGMDPKAGPAHPRVTAPVLKRKRDPEYPISARKERRMGTVIMVCVIDESGRVASVVPLKFPEGSQDLAVTAIRTVLDWTYSPALLDSRPVTVNFTATVRFKLD